MSADAQHDRSHGPRAVYYLAAAYVVRPTNAVPAALLTGWVALCHRRQLLRVLAGTAAVAVPFFAVNVAAFGQLLAKYFSGGRIGLTDDFGGALAANVINPNRGLLIFVPIVVLAGAGVAVKVRRRELGALEVILACWVLLHLVAVSAFREGWWSGHSFGPRFMIETLPPLTYLSLPVVEMLSRDRAARATHRLTVSVVCILVGWGIVVHGQGAFLRASQCWNIVPRNTDDDPSPGVGLVRPAVRFRS